MVSTRLANIVVINKVIQFDIALSRIWLQFIFKNSSCLIIMIWWYLILNKILLTSIVYFLIYVDDASWRISMLKLQMYYLFMINSCKRPRSWTWTVLYDFTFHTRCYYINRNFNLLYSIFYNVKLPMLYF